MASVDSAIMYNLADTLGVVIAYDRGTQAIENKSKHKEIDLGGVALNLGLTVVCHSITKSRVDCLCKVKGNLFLLASCERQTVKVSLINFAKMGCTSKDFVDNRDARTPLPKALAKAVVATYSRQKPSHNLVAE